MYLVRSCWLDSITHQEWSAEVRTGSRVSRAESYKIESSSGSSECMVEVAAAAAGEMVEMLVDMVAEMVVLEVMLLVVERDAR